MENIKDWRPQGSIAYGADYNPDQWERDYWTEDYRLMQEAAVNLVTPAVFSWAKLEPEEGKYNFAWLQTVLDNLAQIGIGVDLATATASPPVWLARRYPDSLPRIADGTVLGFGSRQQYCLSSPAYKAAAIKLVTRLAEEFGNHPAIKLWHIGNEFGCHVWECFCERCEQEFQLWIKDKYKNITALNKAWHTSFWAQEYADFSQIYAPRVVPAIKNPGQLTDWRRFSNAQLLNLFCAEAEILRKITPIIPITTNFMGDFSATNYAEWAKHVDVISDDSYPEPADPAAAAQVAYVSDLMRGIGTERVGETTKFGTLAPNPRSFLLLEQTTSTVQWRTYNSAKRPGQFLLWSIQRWSKGADGIMQFQWRASPAGSEQIHGAMVPHTGTKSMIWKEVVELGQTLKNIPAYGDKSWGLAQVAVVMDWDSEWIRQYAVGLAKSEWMQSVRQWHRTAWEAGYSVDIVRPQTEISGYQVVIVPELYGINLEFRDNLKRALEAGSKIIVVGPTGVVNKDGHIWTEGYLGPLQDVIGVSVVDQRPSSPEYENYFNEPHWQDYRITGAVNCPGEIDFCQIAVIESSQVEHISKLDETVSCAHVSKSNNLDGDGCREYTATQTAFTNREISNLDITEAGNQECKNTIRDSTPYNPQLPKHIKGGIWAERVVLCAEDTEIIGVFTAGHTQDICGSPALTRRLHGNGEAWYVATNLDAWSRTEILAFLTRDLKRPKWIKDDATLLAGVEVCTRPDNLLVVINHSDAAVPLDSFIADDLHCVELGQNLEDCVKNKDFANKNLEEPGNAANKQNIGLNSPISGEKILAPRSFALFSYS